MYRPVSRLCNWVPGSSKIQYTRPEDFGDDAKYYEECTAIFHLFYDDLINLFLQEVTQIDNGSLNKKPSKRVGKTCGNTLLLRQ